MPTNQQYDDQQDWNFSMKEWVLDQRDRTENSINGLAVEMRAGFEKQQTRMEQMKKEIDEKLDKVIDEQWLMKLVAVKWGGIAGFIGAVIPIIIAALTLWATLKPSRLSLGSLVLSSTAVCLRWLGRSSSGTWLGKRMSAALGLSSLSMMTTLKRLIKGP